jgi:Fic family protein
MIYATPNLTEPETAALARIDAIQRELKYYVAEPRRWVGSVRRVLSARAIQGSNSIEGYNVSVEDAVAAIEGDDPTEARTEDWHAVMGYRRAMTYVLQLAGDPHFGYSAALVRSLHFMMTDYDLAAGPGLWRPGALWVRNDKTGNVVYQAPDAEVVPSLIEELVAQLSSAPDAPPMIHAAMAHLNLVMIHPFRDGNGRMARCLQTLALTRDGILVPEFCSIEEHLGANTDAYYSVLGDVGQGAWHPEHDATPWIHFCLTAHYVQAVSVLRRVRESEQIWGELEDLARKHGLSERTLAVLFDAAVGLRVRNSAYRSTLKTWGEEISNQVATLDLRAMVHAGLLEQLGKKRGTYYIGATPLREIRSRLMAGRQDIDTSTLFRPLTDPGGPGAPELPFGSAPGTPTA